MVTGGCACPVRSPEGRLSHLDGPPGSICPPRQDPRRLPASHLPMLPFREIAGGRHQPGSPNLSRREWARAVWPVRLAAIGREAVGGGGGTARRRRGGARRRV